MQLLHPFMPFITEEIYHLLKERSEGDDLCIRQFPPASTADQALLTQGELLKQTISAIRDARVKNNIKPKDAIQLSIQTNEQKSFSNIESILAKQANTESIKYTEAAVPQSVTIVVGANKLYIETAQELDTAAQKEQLQKDLEYQKGFLNSVEKKLSNERFVQNAKPEVVEAERRKKADAEQKIKALEESLRGF
jgi:valyl-tRNA synthetase